MKKDHPGLSVRRQCSLLSLARSSLYYQPRGESAENLAFMAVIRCPAGDCAAICREGSPVSRNPMVRLAPASRDIRSANALPASGWSATCREKVTNAGGIASGG